MSSGAPGRHLFVYEAALAALTPAQRAMVLQGELDLSFPNHPWFPTSKAAKYLNLSPQSVRNLIEAGRLEARDGAVTGTQPDYEVSRRSLLVYEASRRQVTPADYARLVVEAIRATPEIKALQTIAAAAQTELNRRTLK